MPFWRIFYVLALLSTSTAGILARNRDVTRSSARKNQSKATVDSGPEQPATKQ
jgi:hypothetical protein